MKWKLPKITVPNVTLSLPGKEGKYIGISLSDSILSYAEVKVNNSKIFVKREKYINIPAGLIEQGKIKDLEQLVAHLIPEMKEIKGETAVLAAPTSAVVIRKVPLPKVALKEVRLLLENELESAVHLPFSRPYFDFYKLNEELEIQPDEYNQDEQNETQRMDQYLVIAISGDLIDSYVQLFKKLGIKLKVVDIEPLALYRLFETGKSVEDVPERTMFLQLGVEVVNIALFERDIPEFVRNLPFEFSSYRNKDTEPLISGQGLEIFVEELAREIERVVNFYQFNMKKSEHALVKTVYITGDYANQPGLLKLLQARIGTMKIQRFPCEQIVFSREAEHGVHSYTVPIGLAIRGKVEHRG